MHVKARNRARRVDLERTEGGWGPGEGGHGMGRVVGMRSVRSLIVLSTLSRGTEVGIGGLRSCFVSAAS